MDKRGYRQCVRIVITKEDKILLGKKYMKGVYVGYEFPGGGVEEGDSIEETAKKECLEEVGIVVDRVQELGVTFKYDVDYPNPERAKLYRGGIDTFVTASFKSFNKKLHGTEGDSLPFEWVTIDKAIELISAFKNSEYTPVRIKVLNIVKAMQKHSIGNKKIFTDW